MTFGASPWPKILVLGQGAPEATGRGGGVRENSGREPPQPDFARSRLRAGEAVR